MTDVFDDPNTDSTEQTENTGDPGSGGGDDTLVGEGKKYKTQADLEKAYRHADAHIAKLTDELTDLRKQAKSEANDDRIDKLIEEIRKLNTNQAPRTTETREDTTPALDEGKLKDLFKVAINENKEEETKVANRTEANRAAHEAWGDNAPAKLREKAEMLGVGVDFLLSTAERSPRAFKEMVGLSSTKGSGADDNPAAQHQQHHVEQPNVDRKAEGNETDWSYWQKQRRDNPTLYHSKAMQDRRVQLINEGKLKLPSGA